MFMIDDSTYNIEIFPVEFVSETEKTITVMETRYGGKPRKSRYMNKELVLQNVE